MDKKELTRRLLFEAGLEEEIPGPPQISDFGIKRPDGTLEGTSPRILLVIDLPEKYALPVLRELRSLHRFGFQVDVLTDVSLSLHLKGFANVYSTDHLFRAEILASVRALMVVSSQDLLARVALGLQDKPAANAVLQALWYGMDVYMDLECVTTAGGVRCRNTALGTLYASYRDVLCGMGVKAVSPPYLAAMLDRRRELSQSVALGEIGTYEEDVGCGRSNAKGKKERVVVTEKDVLAFHRGSREWILPGDAVVTSLAKDAAEKRGLLLKKNTQYIREE
jgi:hypothetical protein